MSLTSGATSRDYALADMSASCDLGVVAMRRASLLCAILGLLAASSVAAAVYHPQKQTKTSGCRAHAALPDRRCTPGAVFPNATAAVVCRTGYSEAVRDVPTSERHAVFAVRGPQIVREPQGDKRRRRKTATSGG